MFPLISNLVFFLAKLVPQRHEQFVLIQSVNDTSHSVGSTLRVFPSFGEREKSNKYWSVSYGYRRQNHP